MNPLPQGNKLNDLHVFAKDSVLFVGARGTILRTMDGGNSWDISHCTEGVTSELREVRFVNDSIGWTVGYDGTILRTQDGGNTWSQQSSGTSEDLLGLDVMDASTAWAVSRKNSALRTTDGGQNWGGHTVGQWGDPRLTSVMFKNDSVGWCAGGVSGPSSERRVYYTENGGKDWSVRNDDLAEVLNASVLYGDSSLMAVGVEGVVLSSKDGGRTWKSDTVLDYSSALRSIDRLDSTDTWIAGSSGIYHSSDGGDSWMTSFQELGLTAVRFADSLNGWAVGDEGQIFRTSDGGSSWDPKHLGYGDGLRKLHDVHFVNDSMGWAVGSDSAGAIILHSTDSGRTWSVQKQTSGYIPYFEAVHFIDTTYGWVVGDGNRFRTTDGGATWEGVGGQMDFYNDIHFVDSSTGWYVGSYYDNPNDDRIIQHSEDGGETWNSQNSSGSGLNSVHFVDKKEGWAVGWSGVIIHTTNGGTDWSAQASGTDEYLHSVHFIDDETGWAVGSNGTILHTQDGGSSWSHQYSRTSQHLNCVHFTSPDSGWAVGEEGKILHTRDGGQYWGHQNNPVQAELNAVHFSGDSLGWVVGDGQVILRTLNSGGSTGISSHEAKEEDPLELFPNPVREKLHLRLEGQDPRELHLSLWDPMGRLIEEKTLHSGSSEAVLDLSDRKEGIYILRVRTKDESYTEKLIKE